MYKELADRVMGLLLSVHGDGDIHDHFTLDTWEWPQGVAMYAMFKVYLAEKDPAVLARIRDWYDRQMAKGTPSHNINTTAPMLGMTYLYEATGDGKYLEAVRDWADWVYTGLPRTMEGGFQHITSDDFNDQQVWDDTLFMTVLFLYRAGLLLKREEYLR